MRFLISQKLCAQDIHIAIKPIEISLHFENVKTVVEKEGCMLQYFRHGMRETEPFLGEGKEVAHLLRSL